MHRYSVTLLVYTIYALPYEVNGGMLTYEVHLTLNDREFPTRLRKLLPIC